MSKDVIKEGLADKLMNVSGQVKSRVMEILFESELKKRTDACVAVLAAIEEQDKLYKKTAKPDHEVFNEDGSKSASAFTKERVDELKKIREKKARLELALQKALEENDFSAVLAEAGK